MGFRTWQADAHNQCSESIGRPLGSFTLVLGEASVAKRQRCLLGSNPHWGRPCALNRPCLAQRKLPGTCCMQFGTLLSSLDPPGLLCVALLRSAWGRGGIFRPHQTSPLRRTMLEWVLTGAGWGTEPVHVEHWAQPWLIRPRSGRGLVWKNERVASGTNPHCGGSTFI